MSITTSESDPNGYVVPLILTDRPDYAPGSTATFTASGFTLSEAVTFQINLVDPGADGLYGTADDTLEPAPAGVASWTVTEGGTAANGMIVTNWYVDQAYANTTIQLTVTGVTAGMDGVVGTTDDVLTGEASSVVFTDAPPPILTTAPALNLSTAGSSGIVTGAVGGAAIYTTHVDTGTGSGVFPAFERVQAPGIEQGFNTTFQNGNVLDNHGQIDAVPINALGLVYGDMKPVDGSETGPQYRLFRLDIAQNGSQPFLSLDQLKMYAAATSGIPDLATLQNPSDATLLYDLSPANAIFGNWIELKDLNAGNGQSDYALLVPDSAAWQAAAAAGQYLYLYSQFGATEGSSPTDLTSNSSFEEWSYFKAPTIGMPGAASLLIAKVTGPTSNLPISTDGLTLLSDTPITWTYTVSDIGSPTSYVVGSSIVVTDDHGVTVTPITNGGINVGDTNQDGLLESGEYWKYSATGIAVAGPYNNIGTANGTGTDGSGGTGALNPSQDSSGYFGASPSISISKLTNGSDTGTYLVGSVVTWTYAVTNTGNVALAAPTVTDNQPGVTPAYLSGDNNNGVLDVGETWTYSATGTAITGPYQNIGTATDSYTDSSGAVAPLSVSDPSGYFGASPSISISKLTNGSDTGTYLVGSVVTWTYAVTNTGNVVLAAPTVTDNQPGVTPAYLSGDNNNGVLDVGETWTYSATGTAITGPYQNIGTATDSYTDSSGAVAPLSVSDPSSYFGASPSISISKLTNGSDTGTYLVGSVVTWTYAVTNTGNVVLAAPTVTDNQPGVTPAYLSGDNNNGVLDVGETWTYSATGTAITGPYQNIGTATDSYTDSSGAVAPLSVSDQSSYFGATAGITIDKQISANGSTWYDVGKGVLDLPNVVAGSTVYYRVLVTNTSNILNEIASVSDNTGLDFKFGGVGSVTLTAGLTPGHSLYSDVVTSTAAAIGTHSDIATVTATTANDSAGNHVTVTDQDTAQYTVTFTSGVSGLTIGYWFNHQTSPSAAAAAWNKTGVAGNVLLGDVDKSGTTTGSERTLLVPKDAAINLINSSQTANDTRQILLSQAEATQLNINAGAIDPGRLTAGRDLISEAVYWLEGKNLNGNGLQFAYADHHSGNVDANHLGKVDTAPSGSAPAVDYNSTTKAFTFEGMDGFQVANKSLVSSSNAWQSFVDTGILNSATHADFMVNGEGLKNALMAFNQGQLVTSANGQQVGWFAGGGVTDVHMNDAAGMWGVLKDAGIAGIH